MRIDRKREHIEYFLKTENKGNTLFDCVFLEYDSLPELNLEDIDISTNFLGRKISAPIMINAMTGGSDYCKEFNNAFSKIAAEFNIPIAVGSQRAIFESEKAKASYKIVRENSKALLIANLSADSNLEMAKEAIKLIDADALQLHINPGQELVMAEGDRNFKGITENIKALVENLNVPIIVKDIGIGMSKTTVKKLTQIGVEYIDISGYGGTNFIEIESMRSDLKFPELLNFGIPTALATINARNVSREANLISSGGITNSLDIVKALVLGADIVGLAGIILRVYDKAGTEGLREFFNDLLYKIKTIMLILGVQNINDLKNLNYKTTGLLKELREAGDYGPKIWWWK